MNVDPGATPQLAWLPVDQLTVDHAYQRTLESRRSQRLIEDIAHSFKWACFQAILAVLDGSGGWVIIDGQHRVEAARRAGIRLVPAVVVEASSVAEQAAAFVRANLDRVSVNQFALYHARLMANEPQAVRVNEFCQAHGITIPRYTIPLRSLKPGQSLALKNIERIALDTRNAAGRTAVEVIQEIWAQEPGALSVLAIRALSAVFSAHPEKREAVAGWLKDRTPVSMKEEYAGDGGSIALAEDIMIAVCGKEPGENLIEPAPRTASTRQAAPSRPAAAPRPIAVDRARLMAGR